MVVQCEHPFKLYNQCKCLNLLKLTSLSMTCVEPSETRSGPFTISGTSNKRLEVSCSFMSYVLLPVHNTAESALSPRITMLKKAEF